MFDFPYRDRFSLPFLRASLSGARAVVLAILALYTVMPAFGQDSSGNPSGLALPRFASTRSSPVNVRVGPGTQYDISWVYVKSGLPVEIIEEFDTWRHIRDVDGDDGWIHQNLLVGDRLGYVAPWAESAQVPLHASADDDAPARAILSSGLRVQIGACDGNWCDVRTTGASGRSATFSGYVSQNQLWGVYQSEIFE